MFNRKILQRSDCGARCLVNNRNACQEFICITFIQPVFVVIDRSFTDMMGIVLVRQCEDFGVEFPFLQRHSRVAELVRIQAVTTSTIVNWASMAD